MGVPGARLAQLKQKNTKKARQKPCTAKDQCDDLCPSFVGITSYFRGSEILFYETTEFALIMQHTSTKQRLTYTTTCTILP